MVDLPFMSDKLISVKKNFTCNYSNYTNLILKKLYQIMWNKGERTDYFLGSWFCVHWSHLVIHITTLHGEHWYVQPYSIQFLWLSGNKVRRCNILISLQQCFVCFILFCEQTQLIQLTKANNTGDFSAIVSS